LLNVLSIKIRPPWCLHDFLGDCEAQTRGTRKVRFGSSTAMRVPHRGPAAEPFALSFVIIGVGEQDVHLDFELIATSKLKRLRFR
jgi:hypothetical protein